MKVVWLTSYPPYPPDFGGARRTYNLIEQAALAGHDLTLLCFSPGSDEQDRQVREKLGELAADVRLVRDPDALPAARGESDSAAVGKKRKGQLRSLLSRRPYQFYAHFSETMQRVLIDTLREARPDLLQVEYSQMGYYGFPAKVRSVLDLHNVEYEILERTARQGGGGLFRRLYNYVEFLKFRRDEKRIWGKFTRLLTTSMRDKLTVRKHLPDAAVTVAPNGVDSEFFHPAREGQQASGGGIIFTGMMAYFPNVDGARYFHDEIWPLVSVAAPRARWVILGSDPLPEVRALAGPRVEVTGRVDDVRAHVWQADVCIVPLRVGGGTRLKIVEALAMGKAIVTTTVGCEGIEVRDGEHLLIRDDPAEFATAVVELLRDPAQRARLGEAGHKLAVSKYDWRVTAEPMLRAWEQVAAR